MAGITMDGVHYNVGIEYDSMKRSFEIYEGSNTGTSLKARAIRDILGTGYTYKMTFHPIPGKESEYDQFFLDVSAPVEYRKITVPFGQSTITFDAKITSGTDKFHGNYAGKNLWRSLEVTFEFMEPYRT